MFDPIPDPISGKSILPWAVPVTRALNAIGDKVGATARNERDRRASAKPLPFEVRWDATLNNGAGAWKIYLPTEHLLSYGGTYVNTSDISGATPIPDANGDDTAWSVLDDIDTSAEHVWLVVTVSESNGSVVSVDAEFAAEEGQAATGEKVVNVCIAEVSYEEPEDEGDPAVVVINQSVVGALHLGGGGEDLTPDDVSTELIPDPAAGAQPDGDEGKLQIKGFKSGTPSDQGSLAADLKSSSPASGLLLIRTSAGTLAYKPIGTLGLPAGITETGKKIVTDIQWNTTTHELEITHATVNIEDGVITSWIEAGDQSISTTSISSIIGN